MLGHQSGVIAAAAGDDVNMAGLFEGLGDWRGQPGFKELTLLDPARQSVSEGRRLGEDLLEHVMAVAGLVGPVGGHVRGDHGAVDGFALRVENRHPLPAQVRHIAFFQDDETLGDRQQGEDVGGDKTPSVAQADDQRAAFAGRHQAFRAVAVQHAQGVSPFELPRRGLHGG